MIILFISIIFFIEILIFFNISKKVEFYNPILFFLALPVFYANSLFLDYLLFDRGYIQLSVMSRSDLDVSDFNYLIIVLLTFSYVIGVYKSFTKRSVSFNELIERTHLQTLHYEKHNTYSPLKFFFIFICLAYLLTESFQIYGMSREEVRSLGRPIRTLMLMSAFIFLCYPLMYKWKFKLLNIFIFLTLLFFSIVNFERENIILLGFALLLNSKPKRLTLFHVFVGILVVIFMIYYKLFSSLLVLYINGVDISNFTLAPFRLVDVDPIASLLMLADFLDDRSGYVTYYGSYVVNTIMQFLRMGIDINWMSLSEFSKEYYAQGQMGTAFSMIMESMLNFWYFGPFIVGFSITYLFYRTEKVTGFYYKLHYFIFFVFILKLVRTELAVVLKIYMLPAVVAYIIFVWSSNIKLLKK
jgi:hypothetical protein